MLIRQLHNWHSEEMEMDHSAFYGAPWRTDSPGKPQDECTKPLTPWS